MSHWYKNKSYKGIEKDPHRKKKEDGNLRKKCGRKVKKTDFDLFYFIYKIIYFVLLKNKKEW